MGKEVLTQADVEKLFSRTESDGRAAANSTDLAADSTALPQADARPREAIVPYDFKHPERVGKEQIRALQMLHEGFSRNFGTALSGLLRSTAEMKLTNIDQLAYSEFVSSLENPTCFNVLKADPFDGHLILDINPSILFPIIDRLLGGGREPTPLVRRPLTEIELRLVARITGLFLDEFRRAWMNVIELHLAVERVESNPQLVQMLPPNEVVLLLSFEITLGNSRGLMSLCIPLHSIERVGHKLSTNSLIPNGRREALLESTNRNSQNRPGDLVQLVAQLADSKISPGDLIGLRVGDIITTEKDASTPIVISVEGVPKYHARLGSFKGRKAICIDEPLVPPAPKTPKTAVANSVAGNVATTEATGRTE